jgi:hypothetical protein
MGVHVHHKKTKKENAIQWNKVLAKHEYSERRITFGIHTGKMIKDIPTDYLTWGAINLGSNWSDMFIRELRRRNPNLRKI